MRRLGVTARTSHHTRPVAAVVVVVVLMLLVAGCGSSGSDDPAADGTDQSPSASTSAPGERRPAILENAIRVEARGFAFLRHRSYEPYAGNPEGGFGPGNPWARIYSASILNRFGVDYQKVGFHNRAESMPSYLRSRGAHHIRRVDDVSVMGKPAGHWTGRNDYVVFHSYLIDLDDGYTLTIDFERARNAPQQKRIQQAMLDSFHLTEE